MKRLTCGFAIAAQRRARQLHTAKQFWLGSINNAYQAATRNGFTGTIEEWKTQENLEAVQKRLGCPFTTRDLIKLGWKLPQPYGRPQHRAMWMVVAAHGGTLPKNTDHWYGDVMVSPEQAARAARRAKVNPRHVEEIKANIAADPNYYASETPGDMTWKPAQRDHWFPRNSAVEAEPPQP